MTKTFIEKLRDGDAFESVFLAAEKQLRLNKNGNPYVQLELRDKTGSMVARMWNAGENVFRGFDNGDFLLCEGKVQTFLGSLQVVLEHLERVDEKSVDLADFMATTPFDINVLQAKLGTMLRSVANPHLKALGELFLTDDAIMRAFAACPAGIKLHHAYIGGLLEHTVTMMEIADKLLPYYPGVDRDLVLLGLFLHDIGKTRELSYARGFGYRDAGQLVGHIIQGIEMLNEKAARVPDLLGEPLPHELHLRLQHVIASHHGTPEHGAAKVPMTPEAMLIHHIDNLDTRMHMVLRELKADALNTTAWTQWNANLGRKFYKGGTQADHFDAGNESYD